MPGGPFCQIGAHMYFIVPDICNQNGCLCQSRYNGLSTAQIQMLQPSILKSHTRSKMI